MAGQSMMTVPVATIALNIHLKKPMAGRKLHEHSICLGETEQGGSMTGGCQEQLL